jgi:GYF domain 2
MYTIIGGDQKEYGPVTAEQVRQWIAEGRLSAQSHIRAGAAGPWQPLSAFPEFVDALRAPEGQTSAAPPPLQTAAWSAQALTRQPEVQIGECLARSWELLSANFGVLFGATALAWLIDVGCQFVPVIGGIVHWLIEGVLFGGLYLVFLNRIRGRPASVGDVFAGFSTGFVQLMLTGFLTTLLTSIGVCFCLLPALYLLVAWTFSVPLVADKRLEFWSAMELSRKMVTRVWFQMFGLLFVAFLPAILTYIFVQARIAAAMYPILGQLTTSGPPDMGHLSALMLHIARVSVPFGLLFKFVLLLNLPFGVGALMYAYEGIFGTRPAPTA